MYPNLVMKVKAEIDKVVTARFICEEQYPVRLADIALVRKDE